MGFIGQSLRLIRAQRRATRNGFPLASRPDLIRVLREGQPVTLATGSQPVIPPEIKQQFAHADHSTILIAYLDALIDAKNGDPHAHEIADALHAMLHGEGVSWRKHAPVTTLALPHLPVIKKAQQTIAAHPQVLKQAQQREAQQKVSQPKPPPPPPKPAPGTAANPFKLPPAPKPPPVAKPIPLGNQKAVGSMQANLKHPAFNPFHPHHEESVHDLHAAMTEHKKQGTPETHANLEAAKQHFVQTTGHPDASVLNRPDAGLRVAAVSSGLRNGRHLGVPGTDSHNYAQAESAKLKFEAGHYAGPQKQAPQTAQSPTVQSTPANPVPPPPQPGSQPTPTNSQPTQPTPARQLQGPVKLESGKPNPFTGRMIRHPNAHWDPATNSVVYPTGGTQQPEQPNDVERSNDAEQSAEQQIENPHAAALAQKIVAHHQDPNAPPPTTDDYKQFAEHAATMPSKQQVDVRNQILGSVDNPQMKEQLANALRHGLAAKFEHGGVQQETPKEAAKAAEAAPGHPAGPAIAGTPPQGQIQPGRAYNVPTQSLHVDPDRFQYKLHMGAGGVGETLKGVKYNPTFGGIILVWRDPADGKDYVVNGHHRYELAARSKHPDMNVQYIDADNAVQARSMGALANIAEGHGTALDAAKFLRDSGMTPEEMKEKHQISLKGKVAADAAILSKLSDPLFHKVTVGQLDEDRAKAIAEHLAADPSGQAASLGYIEQQETDRGRDIPPKVVEQLAREWAAAPKTENDQPDLFGDAEDRSTFLDRAVLKTRLRADLTKRLNDFLAVSSKRRETAVRGTGNKIEVDKNQQAADEARNLLDTFDRLSPYKGQLQDILNEEGLKYANARNQKHRDIAATNAGARIRNFLRSAGSEVPADGGGQEANRPAGEAVSGAPEAVSPTPDRGSATDGGGGGIAGAGVVEPTAKELTAAKPTSAKDPTAKPGQPPPKDKPITLVYGGSFSPIHTGHIDKGLLVAKKHMEDLGYKVGKVVLAPSADKLLRAKLGDELVPLQHRTEMARLAAKEHPFVDVTSGPGEEAEGFQGKLKRTQLADWAAGKYPDTTVVNVTGEDAAPGKSHGGGSVYSGDAGTSHEGYYYMEVPRDLADPSGLSSGKIRKAMKATGELPEGWMHPEAEAYYKKYLAERNAPDKSPLHPEREEAKTAGIPEMPGLSPDERKIEKTAADKVLTEFPTMRRQYLQNNAKIGPNGDIESVVLNTDEWRQQFEGYTGTNANAVHEPASYANKKLLAEMFRSQKGKGNNRFALYAGGGGSGKGTAISNFFEEDQYPLRVDQVSDSFTKASALMDKAKEHGFDPEYIFIDRPPEEAWGGVVGRAINLHKKGELARTVPLDIALRGNLDARKTALEMLKKREDVPANIIDNTPGKPGKRRLLTDRNEAIQYLEKRIAEEESKLSGGLREKLHGEVVNRHLAGEIPEHIAHGLVGKEAIEEAKRGRARVPESKPVPTDNAARADTQATENDRRGESGRPAASPAARGTSGPGAAADSAGVGAESSVNSVAEKAKAIDVSSNSLKEIPNPIPYAKPPFELDEADKENYINPDTDELTPGPVEKLDPSKLVSTQSWVKPGALNRLKGPLDDKFPIMVIRHGGKDYIENGNHRAVKALREGKHIAARIFTIDENGKLDPTGKPHESPTTLSTAHAPAGGSDAEGKHFEGGQFVPEESHAISQGKQSGNDKREHQSGEGSGQAAEAGGSDRSGGGPPIGGKEGPLPPSPPEKGLNEHPDEMPAVRALKGLWEHARDAGSKAILESAKETLAQFSTAALYDAAEEFGHPEYRDLGRGDLLKRIFGWLDWMATTTHKPGPGQPPFHDVHYNPPYPEPRSAYPVGSRQNPDTLPSAITPHQVAAAYRQAKTMTDAEFADIGKKLQSLSLDELHDTLTAIGINPNPTVSRDRIIRQIHDMIGARRTTTLSTDAYGHEHRESGPEGGQFAPKGQAVDNSKNIDFGSMSYEELAAMQKQIHLLMKAKRKEPPKVEIPDTPEITKHAKTLFAILDLAGKTVTSQEKENEVMAWLNGFPFPELQAITQKIGIRKQPSKNKLLGTIQSRLSAARRVMEQTAH